jgi:hypothetical protein
MQTPIEKLHANNYEQTNNKTPGHQKQGVHSGPGAIPHGGGEFLA